MCIRDSVLDFRCHPLRLRAGEVDFIDNRKHIQVMVQGQVPVSYTHLDVYKRHHHNRKAHAKVICMEPAPFMPDLLSVTFATTPSPKMISIIVPKNSAIYGNI